MIKIIMNNINILYKIFNLYSYLFILQCLIGDIYMIISN